MTRYQLFTPILPRCHSEYLLCCVLQVIIVFLLVNEVSGQDIISHCPGCHKAIMQSHNANVHCNVIGSRRVDPGFHKRGSVKAMLIMCVTGTGVCGRNRT